MTQLDSKGPEDWEDRLAAEGLGVVQPGGAVSSKARQLTRAQMGAYVSAVDAWRRWAETVLGVHPFANAHQRRVWELHAECTPMRDIPSLVRQRRCGRRDGRGSSRASIERIIAAVNAAYPDRPRNPWSSPTPLGRLGNGEIATPPPTRSLPAGEIATLPYTPPERRTTLMQKTYKYDLIQFSRRKVIAIPGNMIANERLNNVEGTPHAGGIDVVVGGKVVTISWDSVSHCVRDADAKLPTLTNDIGPALKAAK